MDHGQQAGQVTLSGSRETQPAGRIVRQLVSRDTTAAEEPAGRQISPGRGEQVAVDPSEGGQSHGDRHDDGEHPQQLLSKRLKSRTTDGLSDVDGSDYRSEL